VRPTHAVVIGASVAGLLAARALSETYDRVTVLERDELPAVGRPRRGVPQSRQLHALLARGSEILEQLFPGFESDLAAVGAIRTDLQRNAKYLLDGRPIRAGNSGFACWGVSRPTLEHLIRARVSRLANVRLRHSEALGLLSHPSAVTGVRIDDPAEPEVFADLVVDAAGRGSRAQIWLRELGRPEPQRTRVQADVVYVTRHYRWETGQLDGLDGLGVIPFPGNPRGAVLLRIEDERWSVVLTGLVGHDPPVDDDGLTAYAELLPTSDVAQFLRTAKPLDEAVKMRYPASDRWHLERQRQHLDGFLVIGDALCSFNPTYGQGMTVAEMEALILRDVTRASRPDLPARFYRAAAKAVDDAWALAVGGDLRFPEVSGPRGAADRVLGWYLDRYRTATWSDPVLARTFLRVANMLSPASALVSPGNVVRVLRAKSSSL
jgi:2-polyprenyl-6-methoxyphenol hydroxylase-like FAD-dependent oxidoreductase